MQNSVEVKQQAEYDADEVHDQLESSKQEDPVGGTEEEKPLI